MGRDIEVLGRVTIVGALVVVVAGAFDLALFFFDRTCGRRSDGEDIIDDLDLEGRRRRVAVGIAGREVEGERQLVLALGFRVVERLYESEVVGTIRLPSETVA